MSNKILGAAALALLLGVSAAAIAQSGGDVRKNDRKIEKALDNRELTPIRPIRRVGPNDWPTANPIAQTEKPDTTGQSTQDSAKQEPAKQDQAKQDPAKQELPKQDQAKQEPAKQELPKQDQAKQEPAKQEPPKQDTADQRPASANQPVQDAQNKPGAQPNAAAPQQSAQQPNAQQPNQAAQKQDEGNKKEDFASIRLGTDAKGRIALNGDQERQIFSVLRRQRLRPADVSVTIGAVTPANVRLGSVSADIVAVLPQFRGYSFFATREELVIVEPATKKMVALVPLKLTATASRPQQERSTTRSSSSSRPLEPGPAISRRETVGAAVSSAVPTEEEILNAPAQGAPSGRSRTYRVEPGDETVVIEQRRRPRIFGIFRY